MKELKDFDVSFIGLKEDEHKFEYQIDNKFFDAFQYDEYNEVSLKVELVFVKKPTMLELEFSVSGTVNVLCDVSGEPFDLDINGELDLVVKFGAEFNNDNEEIIIIPHSTHKMNVSHYIYEMIVLSVPSRRIRPNVNESKAGQEAFEMLENLKIKKNNKEETIDPRWGKLKDLLIDKNQHNGTSKKKDI
jgi:uncharacterized metal-binding protein YceD (DUF177 family)